MSDADSTITLFGSVHALPKQTLWRSSLLDHALHDADTVMFETSGAPAAREEVARLVKELGFLPKDQRLRDLLPDAARTQFDEQVKRFGLPADRMNSMRPWLAGVSLAMGALSSEGFDANVGVESVLEGEARSLGKQVQYFETAEQQMRYLADLPREIELGFLVSGLSQADASPDLGKQMLDMWRKGEVEALGDLLVKDLANEAPEVYQSLQVTRNQDFAAQIADRLAGQGNTLIVVGAAHLAGPDSITIMLAQRGLKVTRVQ